MKLNFEQFNLGRLIVFLLILVFCILFGLYLDGFIRLSVWTVFMPIWIWKVLALTGALGGIISWIARPGSRGEGTEIRSSNVQFRALIISSVLHLLLLLFEILVCVRLDNLSIAFRWILITVPLLVVSLLSMLLCIWAVRYQRSVELEVTCSINALQFVFIAIKLDGYIAWSWMMVFIPTWVTLTVAIVVVICLLILSLYIRRNQHSGRHPDWEYNIKTIISHAFVIVPLTVFAIMLVGKLDGNNHYSFSLVNIPLYIALITSALRSFDSKPGNIWWFGLRRDFCKFLLMDACPCLQEYGNISYKLHLHTAQSGITPRSNSTNSVNDNSSNALVVSEQSNSEMTSPSHSVYSIGTPD